VRSQLAHSESVDRMGAPPALERLLADEVIETGVDLGRAAGTATLA
jgi:hypothetical protein